MFIEINEDEGININRISSYKRVFRKDKSSYVVIRMSNGDTFCVEVTLEWLKSALKGE